VRVGKPEAETPGGRDLSPSGALAVRRGDWFVLFVALVAAGIAVALVLALTVAHS
jgi:hypothetical protein